MGALWRIVGLATVSVVCFVAVTVPPLNRVAYYHYSQYYPPARVARLQAISNAFTAGPIIGTAVATGVLDALSNSVADVTTVAGLCGTDPSATRTLLDALCSLDLTYCASADEHGRCRYALTPIAQAHLVRPGRGPSEGSNYLGGLFELMVSPDGMLSERVASGPGLLSWLRTGRAPPLDRPMVDGQAEMSAGYATGDAPFWWTYARASTGLSMRAANAVAHAVVRLVQTSRSRSRTVTTTAIAAVNSLTANESTVAALATDTYNSDSGNAADKPATAAPPAPDGGNATSASANSTETVARLQSFLSSARRRSGYRHRLSKHEQYPMLRALDVLDMGCGSGVFGYTLARFHPWLAVTFVDHPGVLRHTYRQGLHWGFAEFRARPLNDLEVHGPLQAAGYGDAAVLSAAATDRAADRRKRDNGAAAEEAVEEAEGHGEAEDDEDETDPALLRKRAARRYEQAVTGLSRAQELALDEHAALTHSPTEFPAASPAAAPASEEPIDSYDVARRFNFVGLDVLRTDPDRPAPLPRSSFDVVLVSHVLSLMDYERAEHVLSLAHALLRPGGWLVVHDVLTPSAPPSLWDNPTPRLHSLTLQLLSEGGRMGSAHPLPFYTDLLNVTGFDVAGMQTDSPLWSSTTIVAARKLPLTNDADAAAAPAAAPAAESGAAATTTPAAESSAAAAPVPAGPAAPAVSAVASDSPAATAAAPAAPAAAAGTIPAAAAAVPPAAAPAAAAPAPPAAASPATAAEAPNTKPAAAATSAKEAKPQAKSTDAPAKSPQPDKPKTKPTPKPAPKQEL